MADKKFVLSDFERQSPLWIRLTEHYEARLITLRVQNDGDRSPEQTAKQRGRIAEVKNFLALDNPVPEVLANDD